MIRKKPLSKSLFISILITMLFQAACSTPNKNIALGAFVGGAAGAVAGHELTRKDESRTRNTVITSIVSALVVGGALAWHYREMEQQLVQVSGRYSRYRLCDPEEMRPDLLRQFDPSRDEREEIHQIPQSHIGDLAMELDDETKWVYPTFRKRFLMPDLGETQVISKRYVWEIIKPGYFVTRSLNPHYFSQEVK